MFTEQQFRFSVSVSVSVLFSSQIQVLIDHKSLNNLAFLHLHNKVDVQDQIPWRLFNIDLVCPIWLPLFFFFHFKEQWKPLNVITDNVVIWSIWSNLPGQINPKYCQLSDCRWQIAYCYHLVNVIIWLCPRVITLSGIKCNSQHCLHPSCIRQDSNSQPLGCESSALTTRWWLLGFRNVSSD
jgi:hypothetical protein